MTDERYDVVVVGAGLSGLAAARLLSGTDRRVLVVDKGRGVGGRLATRRIGGGLADHGAQFFTVRTPEFGRLVEQLLSDGTVFEWSRGWSDGSLIDSVADGYPRYAAAQGMNRLARHLATGLDIHTDVRVTAVSMEGNGWRLSTEAGQSYLSRELLLTPPVPQSLALLDQGGTALAAPDRDALERVTYAPCLCGLFVIDGDVDLPAPGALQRPTHAVSWIADNLSKGISSRRVITVHAGPERSRELYDHPEQAVLDWLLAELKPFLSAEAVISEQQLKRWRYALPLSVLPAPFLRAAGLPPVYFAGDAFNGPRVEGAYLSGIAAATALAAERSVDER